MIVITEALTIGNASWFLGDIGNFWNHFLADTNNMPKPESTIAKTTLKHKTKLMPKPIGCNEIAPNNNTIA